MCHVFTLVVLAALGASPAADQSAAAAGDDFRVENTVFAVDQREPPCESTTIFHQGVVYDCMKTPAETIVLDAPAGRFVLLNPTRKSRAELPTSELAAFTDQLQRVALKSKEPLVKFLAAPKFDVRFDRVGNELSLGSAWANYRLTVVAESQAVADRYRQFSDSYARLNALLNPGSCPPFGRLAVNAELAERNVIPSEVVLTVSSLKQSSGSHRVTIRSQHRLVRPLDASDMSRVADARQQMKNFKVVTFDEYRKSDLR
ncbi:MAG: hypothetical protein ABFC63_04295 [Thermoguttaceae bacterium]